MTDIPRKLLAGKGMHRRGPTALVCLLLWLLFPVPATSASLDAEVARQILEAVASEQHEPLTILGHSRVRLQQALADFYRQRNFAPAWISEKGVSEEAILALDILRSAGEEGLCPEDYHLAFLDPLFLLAEDYSRFHLPADPRWMTQLDLLLSDAILRFATHLAKGRVDGSEIHEMRRSHLPNVDPARMLNAALTGGRLESALADSKPPHRGYVELRRWLEKYRQVAARGGWPRIPDGPILRPGKRDRRVPLLRQRLWDMGDLLPPVDWETLVPGPEDGIGDGQAGEDFPPFSPPVHSREKGPPLLLDVADESFDEVTVKALRSFQQRHGLNPDGVLGPRTLADLNAPVESRIRGIELNLERWRWLPKNLGKKYLLVNAADFRIQLVEDGEVVMTMPVVVGTGYRKTPVFSSRLTYLELAPFWFVPPTILREDKLPLIKADPNWLSRNHFEIVPWGADASETLDPLEIDWRKVRAQEFPGILRMKPGPWNPLGHIKFMFPNRHAVYLHDTPERHLFRRNVRSFSSGCIRIERPLDLAQHLLEGEGWTCDRLIDGIERDTPQRVDLPRPLPVHLLYWTAWVDERGRIQFREDIYQRDLDLELALFGGASENERPADQPSGEERIAAGKGERVKAGL